MGHRDLFVCEEKRQDYVERRLDSLVGLHPKSTDEILVLANDLEQTLARVFRTMEGIIQYNPEL